MHCMRQFRALDAGYRDRRLEWGNNAEGKFFVYKFVGCLDRGGSFHRAKPGTSLQQLVYCSRDVGIWACLYKRMKFRTL